MTTTAKPTYGTPQTITWTLASLASDTSLLAGRESNSLDNSTDLADDYSLHIKFTTGTTPTASRQVGFFACPSADGSLYAGKATGSDAGLTLTAPEVAQLYLIGWYPTDGTSNHQGNVVVPSLLAVLKALFLPKKCNFWCVHNTAVNFNATGGNFELKAIPIQMQSV